MKIKCLLEKTTSNLAKKMLTVIPLSEPLLAVPVESLRFCAALFLKMSRLKAAKSSADSSSGSRLSIEALESVERVLCLGMLSSFLLPEIYNSYYNLRF